MATNATVKPRTRLETLELAVADLDVACESLQDARAELMKIGLDEELVAIGSHINYADIGDLIKFVNRFAESLETTTDCPDCGHSLLLHTPHCGEEEHEHDRDCYECDETGHIGLCCREKEGPCNCDWASKEVPNGN